MPPKKKKQQNPLGPEDKNSIAQEVLKKQESDDQIFQEINSRIIDAQEQRGGWTQKRDMYHRMRMRLRKEKTFPFPGCSNLRLPTLEKYIKKAKASLIAMIWAGNPKATVMPTPTGSPEGAAKLEYYIDYLIDFVMRPLRKLVMVADKMEQDGFSFMEVLWKIEDEKREFEIDLEAIPIEVQQLIFNTTIEREALARQLAQLFEVDLSETVLEENLTAINTAIDKFLAGEKKARITLCDEVYNNPEWVVHDAEYVHAPSDSYLDPQEARMIAVEIYEPLNVVKKKAQEGIYEQMAFDVIDALGKVDPATLGAKGNLFRNTDATKDMREGIERLNSPSRNVKLYRCYAWYDLDGDGIEERNVFILAPEFRVVLAKFPFKYKHRKWPIVRFDSEVIDNRWYASRGYPELLEDIVKEIDTQHNQKVDQQTIRNTPMFTFRSGVVNPRLVKFIPGQGIPVPGTTPLDDAISVMRNESSNAEFSYRDEQMLLQSEIQEIMGQVDYSLQSQINRREPRTNGEVQSQSSAAQTVFGLEAMVFSDSFNQVLDQTVALIQQYLPEEVFFSVAGEGTKIRMSREEIQGGYFARVRANDLFINPQVRIQMELQKKQMIADPLSMQLGIVGPQQLFYINKRILQTMGEHAWQQMIQIPPPPPPPGPPPAITQVKTKFEELTDAEQAQVLMSGGIEPDISGRAIRKMQELTEGADSESAKSGS